MVQKHTRKGTVTKTYLLNTIRLFCTECCGGYIKERMNCTSDHCKLWPYRNGNARPEDLDESQRRCI